MRPADLPRALQIALGGVSAEAVEADALVRTVRARRDDRERERTVLATAVHEEATLLAEVDDAASSARNEKARLEAALPLICSRVLVGDATAVEEGALLDKIVALERQLRRHELGRPGVAARVTRARAAHDPVARDVAELELDLAKLRELARENLARAALGWDPK